MKKYYSLKLSDSGMKIEDIYCLIGISKTTFYNWTPKGGRLKPMILND